MNAQYLIIFFFALFISSSYASFDECAKEVASFGYEEAQARLSCNTNKGSKDFINCAKNLAGVYPLFKFREYKWNLVSKEKSGDQSKLQSCFWMLKKNQNPNYEMIRELITLGHYPRDAMHFVAEATNAQQLCAEKLSSLPVLQGGDQHKIYMHDLIRKNCSLKIFDWQQLSCILKDLHSQDGKNKRKMVKGDDNSGLLAIVIARCSLKSSKKEVVTGEENSGNIASENEVSTKIDNSQKIPGKNIEYKFTKPPTNEEFIKSLKK